MRTNQQNILQPCDFLIVIKQVNTVNAHGKSEVLGTVLLKLAEFADKRQAVRRFLLSDSKVNCTLKVTINMSLIKGSPLYKTPTNTSTTALSDDELLKLSEGALSLNSSKREVQISNTAINAAGGAGDLSDHATSDHPSQREAVEQLFKK